MILMNAVLFKFSAFPALSSVICDTVPLSYQQLVIMQLDYRRKSCMQYMLHVRCISINQSFICHKTW